MEVQRSHGSGIVGSSRENSPATGRVQELVKAFSAGSNAAHRLKEKLTGERPRSLSPDENDEEAVARTEIDNCEQEQDQVHEEEEEVIMDEEQQEEVPSDADEQHLEVDNGFEEWSKEVGNGSIRDDWSTIAAEAAERAAKRARQLSIGGASNEKNQAASSEGHLSITSSVAVPLLDRVVLDVFTRMMEVVARRISGPLSWSLPATASSPANNAEDTAFWRRFADVIDPSSNLLGAHRFAMQRLASVDAEAVVQAALQWLPELSEQYGGRGGPLDNLLAQIDAFNAEHPVHRAMIRHMADMVVADVLLAALEGSEGIGILDTTVSTLIEMGIRSYRAPILHHAVLRKRLEDRWARVLGLLSNAHLDRIIASFKAELQQHEDKSGRWPPDCVRLFNLLLCLRVELPAPTSRTANQLRLSLVLNMHKELLSNNSRKINTDVVRAHLRVLDTTIRQVERTLSAETVEFFFVKADKLSHKKNLKGAALTLMASLLQRAPDRLFESHFGPFLSKRILSHLHKPKKASHCLRILLRLYRGMYQGRNATVVLVHPRSSSVDFHPYACTARVPTTDDRPISAIRIKSMLEETFASLGRAKTLNVAFATGHEAELIDLFVQFAVHDLEYVAENILRPMLVIERGPSYRALVALRSLERVLDDRGAFARFAPMAQPNISRGDDFASRVSAVSQNLGDSLQRVLAQCLYTVGVAKLGTSNEALVVQRYDIAKQIQTETDTEPKGNETSLWKYGNHDQALDRLSRSCPESDDDDDGMSMLDMDGDTTANTMGSSFGSDSTRKSTPAKAQAASDRRHRAGYTIASLAHNTIMQVHGADEGLQQSPDRDEVLMQRRMSIGDVRRATGADTDQHKKKKRSEYMKLLTLAIASVRVMGVIPFEKVLLNAGSSVFLPRELLHSHWPLATAVSSALQRICSERNEWFERITIALQELLAQQPLEKEAAVITILRQLAVNVDVFASGMMTRSTDTFVPVAAMHRCDAIALVYMSHGSDEVRRAAYALAQCVWDAFRLLRGLPYEDEDAQGDDPDWCLAEFLSLESAYLLSEANQSWKVHIPLESCPPETDEPVTISLKSSMLDATPAVPWISVLIAIVHRLNGLPQTSVIRELAQAMVTTRLLQLLAVRPFQGQKCSQYTLACFLSFSMAMKTPPAPSSMLSASMNEEMLSRMWAMLFAGVTSKLHELILFGFESACECNLGTLLHTMNAAVVQSRDGSDSRSPKGGRDRSQETRPSLPVITRLLCRYAAALSSPKRLCQAFITNTHVRDMFVEYCRYAHTQSLRRASLHPDHLGLRAQFLANVCTALRMYHEKRVRSSQEDGLDSPEEAPEARRSASRNRGGSRGNVSGWPHAEQLQTLIELRTWSECGAIQSPASITLVSFMKSRWHLQCESMISPSAPKKDRILQMQQLQADMDHQLPIALRNMRIQAFHAAAALIDLGTSMDAKQVEEQQWLDWAISADVIPERVPMLRNMLAWNSAALLPQLLDQLYIESSEDLFASVATLILPQTRNLGLEQPQIVGEEAISATCIRSALAPLLVCAVFHLGSYHRRVAQLASTMLGRLSEIMLAFEPDVRAEKADKALHILREQHPALQSEVLTVRLQNALIISKTVCELCPPSLLLEVLNEAVLRWAQFHRRTWIIQQWLIESFEPWFVAMPLHRLPSASASLLVRDMFDITRSLTHSSSPALTAMLTTFQSFAGARGDKKRASNVRFIVSSLLDLAETIPSLSAQPDLMESALAITIELYRVSASAVLDTLLQRFDCLDSRLENFSSASPSSHHRSSRFPSLRMPSVLLSGVVGAGFKESRSRLASILHHAFLWLELDPSCMAPLIQHLIHFLRDDNSNLSLTSLIRPVPSLDRVSFEWTPPSMQLDGGCQNDDHIMSLLERISAASEMCSEIVVPISDLLLLLARWTDRAYSASVVDQWADAALRTAMQTPRRSLALASLRAYALLQRPITISTICKLSKVMASTPYVEVAREAIQALLASQTVRVQNWSYETFQATSALFVVACSIIRRPSSALYSEGLILLDVVVKSKHFMKCLRVFPQDVTVSRRGLHPPPNTGKTLAAEFLQLLGPDFIGLQSLLIKGMITEPEIMLSRGMSMFVHCWRIRCDSVIDIDPSRFLCNIVAVLPWLCFRGHHLESQQDRIEVNGEVIVVGDQPCPSVFCRRLAEAIEDSDVADDYAAVAFALRQLASVRTSIDAADAINHICSEVAQICFPMFAGECAVLLLRLMKAEKTVYQSAAMEVASCFMEEASKHTELVDSLIAFEDVVNKASSSLVIDALQVPASRLLETACRVTAVIEDLSPQRHRSGFPQPKSSGTRLGVLMLNNHQSSGSSADPRGAPTVTQTSLQRFVEVAKTVASIAPSKKAMPAFEDVEMSGPLPSSIRSRRQIPIREPLGEQSSQMTLTRQAKLMSHLSVNSNGESSDRSSGLPCTLDNVLQDDDMRSQLRIVAERQQDVRILDFYERILAFSNAKPHEQSRAEANEIMRWFVVDEAPERIEFEGSIGEDLLQKMERISSESSDSSPNRDEEALSQLFTPAMAYVRSQMIAEVWPAFVDSIECDALVRAGKLTSP